MLYILMVVPLKGVRKGEQRILFRMEGLKSSKIEECIGDKIESVGVGSLSGAFLWGNVELWYKV